jgi:glycosyltransferase involved in cell wall biosynthesis
MTRSHFHTRRRLLFLVPYAPRLDATHGGARVMAQLIANLAAGHEVAILCLRALDEPPLDQVLKDRCKLVEEIIRPGIGRSLAQRSSLKVRVITSLLRGKPGWATVWKVAKFEERLRTLVREWRPDIVQIEYHVMGQYLSALDDCAAPRVLTEHEPGAAAFRDLRNSHRGFARMLNHLKMLVWEEYERTIIEKVQAVVVFTERDRQAIMQLAGRTPVVQIPLGANLPEHSLNPLGTPPLSLVFVGSFIHPPNVDAALRLIKSIFPRLRSRYPDLMLYIIGDKPPPEIHKMAGKYVIVTGRVPNVTPYLDQAALVVVPLRFGGGMRVKVLEALAAGKPVVASPRAIEGLDVNGGEQVVVAESDEEFREAISQLLSDPERRALLAAQARTWARANLDWRKSIAAYEKLYEELIEQAGRGGNHSKPNFVYTGLQGESNVPR